jgi:hypothetical protein
MGATCLGFFSKGNRMDHSFDGKVCVGLQVEGKGVDGEEVRVRFPTAAEILDLIETGRKQEILNLGTPITPS